MVVKLIGSSFLKVIRMSTKRLYLIILMLVIGCQQAGIGTNTPAFGANATNEARTEAKPDEQLEINKNALLEGPSEQIRIKAATVMLGSENPLARAVLLDALKQTKNSAARMAVCKALIQARASNGEINNKEDFIQPLLGVFATEIAEEVQLAAAATLIFEYEKNRGIARRYNNRCLKAGQDEIKCHPGIETSAGYGGNYKTYKTG